MSQKVGTTINGSEVNANQEDLNMSFEEGNQQQVSVQGEMDGESSLNFLEEALNAVQHHFEGWNTIINESTEEIPILAEEVYNYCLEMNEIRMDLESKYAELGNLAGDLNVFYKDQVNIHPAEDTATNLDSV